MENLKKIFLTLKEKTSDYTFELGGSYALKHVYGILDRDPDDIDIIIKPIFFKKQNTKLKNLIVDLFSICTITDCLYDVYTNNSEYELNFKIKYNICNCSHINFILPKKARAILNSPIEFNNIPVSSLAEILKAKASYNRDKDKLDFYSINTKLSKLYEKNS